MPDDKPKSLVDEMRFRQQISPTSFGQTALQGAIDIAQPYEARRLALERVFEAAKYYASAVVNEYGPADRHGLFDGLLAAIAAVPPLDAPPAEEVKPCTS